MKKIVLVDDETELRQAIVDIIPWELYGYQIVYTAENGQQALSYCTQHSVDIVLTDLVMPKMDGLQLIKHLKQSQPELPIIILSNYSDFSYVKQALLLGAEDYLLKASISEYQIINILQRLFSKTDERPNELSKEMQLRLLLSDFSNNPEEHRQFFSQFNTATQTIVLASDQLLSSVGQDTLFHSLSEYFSDTTIILTHYQQWIVLLLDTDFTEEQIKQTFHRALFNQEEAFFVAKKMTANENLKSVLINELVPKLAYRFSLNNERFIWSSYEWKSDVLPHFDKEGFRQSCKEQRLDLAINYLLTYANSLQNLKLNEEDLKDFASTSFFLLFNELEKTNQFSAELNLTKLELLKTITTSTNANELLENYHEGILQVQQMVAVESDSESLLLKKISLYIYEHSNQDLSLKKVAEHFHYNYSYLSNLFSKQKQISYTEYVTTMRIEKSKELLRKGKMNISEIADMVGYADVSYFSKVFKKMTGSTPSEYMRGKLT